MSLKFFLFFFQDYSSSSSSSSDNEDPQSEPGIEPLNFNSHRTTTHPIAVPQPSNNNNNTEIDTQNLQAATSGTTQNATDIGPTENDGGSTDAHLGEGSTADGSLATNVISAAVPSNQFGTTSDVPESSDGRSAGAISGNPLCAHSTSL
jgi:hypothetical protein